MVITKMSGGFGNQLFQFAAGLSYAEKYEMPLMLNLENYKSNIRKFELYDFFAIDRIAPSVNFFQNSLSKIIKEDKEFIYREIEKPGKLNVMLDGYFQSEKYVRPVRRIVSNLFSYQNYKYLSNDFLDKIVKTDQSVSIHIRRGDYVLSENANAYHGVIELSYYKAAVDCVRSKLVNPFFYIFTDDTKWARENIHKFLGSNYLIVHGQTTNINDFLCMRACKHHIIANSSFSWWAAYLNDGDPSKIVFAPRMWLTTLDVKTTDLLPEDWKIIG